MNNSTKDKYSISMTGPIFFDNTKMFKLNYTIDNVMQDGLVCTRNALKNAFDYRLNNGDMKIEVLSNLNYIKNNSIENREGIIGYCKKYEITNICEILVGIETRDRNMNIFNTHEITTYGMNTIINDHNMITSFDLVALSLSVEKGKF